MSADAGQGRALLATGFIADSAGGGSVFPSAGGNSADAGVQSVYWRCIACFFYAARLFNPALRLALFSNVLPPMVDGVDLRALLDRWNVAIIQLPLTHRLPRERAQWWGNVFYVLDIVEYLKIHDSRSALLLLDSDVLVTGAMADIFARLAGSGNAGYVLDTLADADINGLSRRQMGAIAQAGTLPQHYGGELFGIDLAKEKDVPEHARALWTQALTESSPASTIRTEEQFWSILYAQHTIDVAGTDDVLKRMWTDPRHNNVVAGDERLTLWHLPAEKRQGFRDLFNLLKNEDFRHLEKDVFRRRAGALMGVPRKNGRKWLRDGGRQIFRRLKVIR